MPSPLHKSPAGLLELFRLKALGRQPDQFDQVVAPSVDVGAFYGADILGIQTSSGATGALANLVTSVTFPTAIGIVGMGFGITVGAAGGTNLLVSWGIRFGVAECPLGSVFVPSFAAAQVVQAGTPVPRLVVPGGTALYVRASGTAAGSDHSLFPAILAENYAPLS